MTPSSWIRRLFAQRAATSRPAVRRRPRRAPLQLEALETRLTPTGNLAITQLYVTDAHGNQLSTVNTGESVYILAAYTISNLPASASYRFSLMANGLTRDTGYTTYGAGYVGSFTAAEILGPVVATPGTNQVTATVDPDQSVPETTYADNSMSTTFSAVAPAVGGYSITPAQMRAAYGVGSIPNFGAAAADGSGQTIALVDAYNDPTILSDLDAFDQAMSTTTTSTQTLYQQYGAASSFVHVYNQSGVDITANIGTSGQNGVPPVDPTGGWEGEEALDVEWAHAMAPGAKIDIVECDTSLFTGNTVAAGLPGVSAVSNSWGNTESTGQTSYDSSTFVTPSGHTGVTFLASSGDGGANMYSGSSGPTQSYPATSPNVVAVGGTQLTINNDGYGGETGWSFSAPANIVTNGSGSYAQQGNWTSQPGGYSGNVSTATGGSASSASWTFSVNSGNEGWAHGTEVSATWPASINNASSATYTIYDGSPGSGKVLASVLVNQARSPLGTAVGGSQFQELGVFFPTLDAFGNGTLTVVLNASTANGTVVADAIGLAQDWASGGGPSSVEAKPSYQQPFQFTGARSTPDVSLDAITPVYIVNNGNLAGGAVGTSLSCPCWAGLIAIANQGRVAGGATTFNSPTAPTQTLQALYSMPAADFNDITSGYNGFSAGYGYDFVTGRGSPVANTLIPDLVNYGSQTAGVSGPSNGVLYQMRTFTFTANGSAGDNAAGYTYAINWGDGSPVQTVSASANNTTITLSHTYTQTGTFSVSATATDQFGYTAPVVSQAITVGVIATEADPAGQGGVTGLAISDVAGSAGVVLTPTGSGDNVQVTRNGVLLGTFNAPGGVVAIYGDGGTDLVTLKGLSSSANTFTINGNTVTLTAAALPPSGFSLDLSAISNLTLQGGSKANTFTFAGTGLWVSTTIRGSGTANTVIGPEFNSTWDITAANAGFLFAPSWSFSGIQNLTGGSQGNDFIFSKGASLSGKLNGGSGGGALDESAFTTAVTVNLQTSKATGVGGTFSNMVEFIAGSGKNTVIGANVADTFDIFSFNDCAINNVAYFFGFANLTGGTVSNDFVFADGQGVSGKITGAGTGFNSLDYSAYTTGIYVNLHTGKATGTGGISKINGVFGGSGNDILVGYGSNVYLQPGSGNDLVIGGSGLATFQGGSGQDLVIAGSTSYDTNAAALQAIENYWSNTAIDEATRVNQLSTAGVGGYRLTTTTVKHAATSDLLDLYSAYDWAFWRQTGTNADSLYGSAPDFSTFI
jgi:hypothetical protein